MRDGDVLRRLNKYGATTAQDILDYCNLPLQYVGGGAFRDTYHVIGTGVVIKLPRQGLKHARNIQHARDEMTIWNRMRRSKKWSTFRPFLPEIIGFSKKTGVMVVRRYDGLKYSRDSNQIIKNLEKSVTSIIGTTIADIHYGNLGVDKDGGIRFIDMGLFIKGASTKAPTK